MMNISVLGAAAGGGFPQWNCRCAGCSAARDGRATAQTQSSIAIRAGDGPWFLVNASPDLREQLAHLPGDVSTGIRSTPIAGVILTDAEIDHTAGLLLLRESDQPLNVYCTEEVRAALSDQYPVLSMLEHYCGVRWRPLVPGEPTGLEGSSLEIEGFATGGDAPLYMGGAPGPSSIGLSVRDRHGGGVLCYAPAIESLDDALTQRLASSDTVLADGTFWREDELVTLGLSTRDSWAMGHAPLTGPRGTLEPLGGLGTRVILIHINNTNPLLLEDSDERAIATGHGLEIAHDGMEIAL
jgi:pyrroloquinoline quinone biosynthesis protein B